MLIKYVLYNPAYNTCNIYIKYIKMDINEDCYEKIFDTNLFKDYLNKKLELFLKSDTL